MDILILGGGFIGHHVAEQLQYDHNVTVSTRSKIPDERLKCIPNVKTIQAEVQDMNGTEKFDTIVYCASTPNANDVKNDINDGSAGIINGPVHVIKHFEPDHFVYLSSSMVYGNFNGRSPTEKSPLNPIEPYGILKAASEKLVKFYCSQVGTDYTIIRPSAVYGPRDKIQRVISKFIEAAQEGKELHVKGSQELDFTYVEDLAKGICLTVQTETARNETFNLTRSEPRSLHDAAKIVQLELQNGTIILEQHDELYPVRGALDITKARELLGYNPETSLEQGIKLYVQN